MIGAVFSFFWRMICYRLIPIVVIGIALFLGWIQSTELPIGTIFALVVPLSKGYPPPALIGHGILDIGPPTVPIAIRNPLPREANETFIKLSTGYDMPQQGLGMCCRVTAYDDEAVEKSIHWYMTIGGRLIDTAHLYLNHKAIGKGLKKMLEFGVPREEMFIVTKIFPTHYGYKTALETVPKYLEELGLDYIDLILMHQTEGIPIVAPFSKECKGKSKADCRKETFRALSDLSKQGIVRSVGVSNFAVRHLEELVELQSEDDSIAPVAVNQIPFNPWIPQTWVDTYEFCQKNNIAVMGYNSLGGLYQHALASTVDTLKRIAEKHKKHVAQIMVRWTLQKGVIAIPGTGDPSHMQDNLMSYKFELSDEEMEEISNLRFDESAKEFYAMTPFDEMPWNKYFS